MITPQLIDDLKRDEGLRLTAYRDGGGVLTIGYGHTGADVFPGQWWMQTQADAALVADLATAESELDRALPWWRTLDDVRQDVMVEMAFNIGVGRHGEPGKAATGLCAFVNTLAAIQSGDYAGASARMLLSRWASQVGDRAQRLAFMMRTATRPREGHP